MTIRLNFGCGDQRKPGYIGIDKTLRHGTDLVCELNHPLPFASQTVDHIYAKSVLEHIEGLEDLLCETQRILTDQGTFYIYVPHWNNPFYYSDYTHKRFFGLATFDYFVRSQDQKYRHVPVYKQLKFHIVNVRLIFKSPFRMLNWLDKGIQLWVNRSVGMQLFYEYYLSSLIPCYAIEFLLQMNP
jgi:SAM-dependent methyltransferase